MPLLVTSSTLRWPKFIFLLTSGILSSFSVKISDKVVRLESSLHKPSWYTEGPSYHSVDAQGVEGCKCCDEDPVLQPLDLHLDASSLPWTDIRSQLPRETKHLRACMKSGASASYCQKGGSLVYFFCDNMYIYIYRLYYVMLYTYMTSY